MALDLLSANDRPGCYPASWYAADLTLPAPLPAAQGALRCDVCIVGGGYTGLSAALHLAERGYDVVLLEAQRLGFGASGRNGGQVGSGQRQDQTTLEKQLGQIHARALWQLGQEAVALVRELAGRAGVDLSEGIIYADHRERFVPHSHAYAEKLARDYGYEAVLPLDRQALRALVDSPAYHGGVLDRGAAHLQPLRYVFGLARLAQAAGVRLYENSQVHDWQAGPPARLHTARAQVQADHVLLAANGYLGHLQPRVAARVMPINNFIIATEVLSPALADTLLRGGYAVADSKFVVNYFRLSPDRRLLFGGAESYGYRFPADIAALVRRPMLEIFPQLRDTRIDYAWGGTLAITRARMPCFMRLAPHCLSASGYSGHGVAMATLAGKLMAEAVAGQAERFDVMARVPVAPFPGGTLLRWPLLVLAMLWYSLRDRL